MFFPCLRGKLGCKGPDGHIGQIADVTITSPPGTSRSGCTGSAQQLVMTPLVIDLRLLPPEGFLLLFLEAMYLQGLFPVATLRFFSP